MVDIKLCALSFQLKIFLSKILFCWILSFNIQLACSCSRKLSVFGSIKVDVIGKNHKPQRVWPAIWTGHYMIGTGHYMTDAPRKLG